MSEVKEIKEEVFEMLEKIYDPKSDRFIYPKDPLHCIHFIGRLSSANELVFDATKSFDEEFIKKLSLYLEVLRSLYDNRLSLSDMSKNIEISVESAEVVCSDDAIKFVIAAQVVDTMRRYQISQSQVKIDELEMRINKLKAQIPGQQGYSK